MSPKLITIVARTILVLWAGFWTWFCVASAVGEKEGMVGGLIHQAPAVVMIVSALVAWRRPTVGGILLIGEALFVASGVWVRPNAEIFAILGLPALVAGILFLIAAPPTKPAIRATDVAAVKPHRSRASSPKR